MVAPLEGPIGVGTLADAVLLGCVLVQSYVYCRNSRRDTWLLKGLVSLILLFSLSHFGCLAGWLWASAQVNAEDASIPSYAAVLIGVSNALGAAILFLVRCFFSCRIMKASNNDLLGFLFFVFCIFSFVTALGVASMFDVNATGALTSQPNFNWIFPLAIIFGLVCDLAINIAAAFYLRTQAQTEVTNALGRVTWLFLLVAETGSMASLVDVAIALVYWLTKTNLAWAGLLVSMAGVFANTLLMALNARGRLHTDIEHQRVAQIGDKLIDGRPKKPPFMINISKKAENNHSEKVPIQGNQ